jgi:hypothetical protein
MEAMANAQMKSRAIVVDSIATLAATLVLFSF